MAEVSTTVTVPTVSPTGAAVVPQSLVKFAVPFFGIIGVLAGLPDMGVTFPAPWFNTAIGVCKALLGIGVALGIASQGARAKAAGAAAATTVETKADAIDVLRGPNP